MTAPGGWPEPEPAPTAAQAAADAHRRWCIKVCGASGTVLVIVGAVLAFVKDSGLSMRGSNDYLCADENLRKVVPPGLWILWLLILCLAIAASTLRRGLTRPDPLSKNLAGLGTVSAIVLFPGWLAIASGMNCAL